MSLYLLLVFIHVTGAVVMFAAWGVEVVFIGDLRRPQSGWHTALTLLRRSRWGVVARIGMMTSLITGIWMMLAWWMGPGLRARAWMPAAIVALTAIVAVSLFLERRVREHLVQVRAGEARADGSVEAAVDPMAESLRMRFALGIAILGLMTMKPALVGSVVMVGAGLVGGSVANAAARRKRGRVRERQPVRS